MQRPAPTEYDPFYRSYIDHVPDGDVLALLEAQRDELRALLLSVPESQGGRRYAPGKWSIREVVGHMIDAERVFAYRVLRIARGDETPLPGFDQDDYVAAANFEKRTVAGLAEEGYHLRTANLLQFASLSEEQLGRHGTASGCTVSVRALLFIIAGHERHHINVLKDRYL